MIRNIIFDWSGTLVDDLPAVWQATNFVFRKAGLEEFTLDRFRAEFCLPFRGFYERYTPHVPADQLEEWFHGHFREVQDCVAELPHAREFLSLCRTRGIRTFLLSTIHRDHFTTQSKVTGFDEYLDRSYVEILDKRTKIRELLAENRLIPEETVFIGDMQHDIETARYGGVFSCAVLTGYTGLDQLRASEPDLIVEHLGEFRAILEQNQWEIRPESHLVVAPDRAFPIVTVGAAIFNADDEVLVVRTNKWSNLWGIPGGKIRFGEDSVAALMREIKEETNLEIDQIRFVLVQDCIHSREFYRDAHFVLLNYICRCRGNLPVILNEEAQEFRWVTLPEAMEMELNQPTQTLFGALARQKGPFADG
jgi:phosphoglycolate phosphatase